MPKARRSNKRKTHNLDAPLKQLEAAQLIRHLTEEEDAYWFKHVLIQETTYESLLKHDRKRLHRAVAQAIEQSEPERLDEQAARLAQHYAEAGDSRKTFEYLVRAGDLAARMQANVEAIERYSQALELSKGMTVTSEQLSHLYSRRGRAMELTSDYDRALGNYQAMAAAGRERQDRSLELAALMASATIHSTPTAKFDPAQAQPLSEKTLALARELHDRAAEAKVLWNLLLLNYFTGNLSQAEEFGKESLALARQYNLREQLGYTLHDLGRLYQVRGQFDLAAATIEQAREIWNELDNKPMIVDNMVSMIFQYAMAGDMDKVIESSDEAYHLSESIGSVWGQGYSRMNTGYIFWERGQIDEAINRMKETMQLADRAGFLIGAVTERTSLARLYAQMGDLAQGFEFAREANELGHALTNSSSPIASLFAVMETMAGNFEEAERYIEESSRTTEQDGLNYGVGYRCLAEGELALAKHDYRRALHAGQELETALIGLGRRIFQVESLWIQARAELGSGQTAAAFAALEQAQTFANEWGSRRLLWEILAAMSDIEQERGNKTAAQALLAEAIETLQYIIDHTSHPLRDSFLGLPNVKRVLTNR